MVYFFAMVDEMIRSRRQVALSLIPHDAGYSILDTMSMADGGGGLK